MSTLGNTGTPSSGWANYSSVQFFTEFTVPSGPGIIVTDIYVYMDKTDSGSNEHCYAAVWDHASGNVLGYGESGPMNQVSTGSVQTLNWWKASDNLDGAFSPFYIAGSTNIWIGGMAGHPVAFNSESGGSSYYMSKTGTPGTISSPISTGIGGLGAYVVYQNAGAWVNTGTTG